MKKIKLFADGLKLDEIDQDFGIEIDGYTFNPSIFKNHGVKDYLNHCKTILEKCANKPISFEVFADDEENMIKQANILKSLGENIYIKVPITFTNGDYTTKVLHQLVNTNTKLNVTAIFTKEQVQKIIPILKDTNSILSVFAGRIFDCGLDAFKIMKEISLDVKKNSGCETLWASPRMPYDYIAAINSGTDIITMQGAQIKKLSLFGKDPKDYSLETVKQFFNDAKASGFKI